jgi:hypothetical protein
VESHKKTLSWSPIKKTLLEELHVLDGLEKGRDLVAKEKLRKIMVISELKKYLYGRRLVRDTSQGLFG